MKNDILTELAQAEGFPRVSIYIPTHVRGPEIEQDRIYLTNALTEAEQQLFNAGLENSRTGALFAEARRNVDDSMFWRFQNRGLATFIDKDGTRWHKIPERVPPLTMVGDRFHVRPLIRMFGAGEARFHILAINRDSVRFFDAGERDIQQTAVKGLPEGIDAITDITELDDDVGFHARGQGKSGRWGAEPKYHALGDSPEDYAGDELREFLNQVAKALDRHLSESEAPLVLFAADRVAGHLRKELTYPHVADETVAHNPQGLKDSEIHAPAWRVAEPLLRRDREAAGARLAACLQGADTPWSNELEDLLRASEEGRIESLFLPPDDVIVWGRYDTASRRLERLEEPGHDREDVLDRITAWTFLNGGAVYSLPEAYREQAGPAAAIMRY